MATELIKEQGRTSYVDLSAIIAGTILALAISLVLLQFGSAIGLAFSKEIRWTGQAAVIGIIATGLWVVWIQITSSLAGGYLSGRMRRPVAGASEHEREIRDGAHGLLVWASVTVAVAVGIAITSAFAALVTEPAVVTEKSEQMMDAERNMAIIFAFVTAATAFVSAAASWWAATLGGEHRDQNIDHSRYVSFRRKK